jgi:low affinity Fe/Cu permease
MLWFAKLSKSAAHAAGTPIAFLLASGLVLLWLVSGPLFGFSDTWQLVINTSTTIVTFLMVFLIQSTQNQDTVAIQIKLDELIRSHSTARNAMIDLEELSDAELQDIRKDYEELAKQARQTLRGREEQPTRA